ncbi:MAG: FAD-dependent oxidoreductase [Planctomycetales bacterium]
MAQHFHTSSRIVIVVVVVSGLSIAVRLAQADLPVTVLEASQLGAAASTRNQGWLYSGAWFAPEQPDLARMCHESMQQTLRFCPDCVEPECGPMVYLAENSETDSSRWTSAWSAAAIPYERLSPETLLERFPDLAISRAGEAFELPDRAIRTELLLRRLADAAQRAGAEVRTGTPVARLIHRGDSIQGVETRQGEVLPARLVILAGNARGGFLHPGFGVEPIGTQREVVLVALKTHLAAVRPEISRSPLCVIDADGFNHLPHPPVSVFGSNRWLSVRDAEDERPDTAEIERLWDHVGRLFPHVRREERTVHEWSGTTVQAMHVDQIEPGQAPLPTVIDHEQESVPLANLISVFPGRASLWPHLAEEAQQVALNKLQSFNTPVAVPPWGTPIAH